MNRARAHEVLDGAFKVVSEGTLKGRGRTINVDRLAGVLDPGLDEEQREALMLWIADGSVARTPYTITEMEE